jgi:hypothetical protein
VGNNFAARFAHSNANHCFVNSKFVKEINMATRLYRIQTHNGLPFWGGRGDDVFHFDIPQGEKFGNARLDTYGGRYNAGARIEAKPSYGDTGAGQTIKVHWWFDGGTDPSEPPFIKYRIRAFTLPVPKRAILVAIENTGQLPFKIGIDDRLLKIVEWFVDAIAEMGAEQNCKRLLDDYYEKLELLVDTDCTKEKIRDKIAELGKNYVLDLAVLGHGTVDRYGQGVLILHDDETLSEADVQEWKDKPDFQGLKLGLVYMMNCQGSKFNNTWLDLGFKTSVGSEEDNWMPEPMFTYFWTRYRNGEAAKDAAQKAWETSKAFWRPFYHRRLVVTNKPPFISISYTGDDEKIEGSRPVVSGDPNFRVTDDVQAPQ